MSLRLLAGTIYETLKVSVPTLLDSLGHVPDPEVCDRRLASWSEHLLAQAGVRLSVRGREHVDFSKSYVVMSNHQSHYDIPLLFQALSGLRLRMVAKRELFKIPIWASAMRSAGFVALQRGDREQARQALSAARQLLLEKHSIWIAPEGTRSLDGSLGDFKPGGFALAIDAAVPILPVTIVGSVNVHKARTLHVHQGQHVSVNIRAPLDTSAYDRTTLSELMLATRATIAEDLAPQHG